MEIKISDAKPEEIWGIENVFYKTWLATYPNQEYGITRDDIEEFYKDTFTDESLRIRAAAIKNLPENIKIIIAKDTTNIIGVCRLRKDPDKNWVRAIYILPEYQGKGIGRMLWEEALKFFDPRQPTIVHVAAYNKNAIAFYEKLGFKYSAPVSSNDRFKMKSGNSIPEIEMILNT